MKKWALGLMLVAMLAAPMLACGFPLPAGVETMAVSKSACATGEDAATCQARQDAYQMMSTLQSVTIPDMTMKMMVDTGDPTQLTTIEISGAMEYVRTDSTDGLGADVHLTINEGSSTTSDGTETISGGELIIVGNTMYSKEPDADTWTKQDITTDDLSGLSLIFGLGGTTGAGLDFYSDPSVFSVEAGADEEYDGQTMHVQTLTVDLATLAGSDVFSQAMTEGMALGGDSVGSELGDTNPEDLSMMLPLVFMMASEASAGTVLQIGADDGYIHYTEDHFTLKLDLPAFEEGSDPVKLDFQYQVSGHMTDFNSGLTIEAPADAVEGEGDLLGGAGLGGSLFGGQ